MNYFKICSITVVIATLCFLNSCKTPVKLITTAPIPLAQLELIAEIQDLSHAESVAYDESYNRLYVSVQGEQEPGDGGIATIDLEGNVINKEFTTGLNNPKGIAVSQEFIYVSDVKELVKINKADGSILQKFSTGEEQFLNDVAIDKDGNVYVSDMSSSSIYKLDDKGTFSKWLTTPTLENPNGLLAIDNELYVAAWGIKGSENDQGHTQGRLLKVTINTKEIEKVTAQPQGNLDGLQIFDYDHFLVSDWRKGTISKISISGEVELFFQSEASVGDILYLKDKKLLALPLNRQNKVQLYLLRSN